MEMSFSFLNYYAKGICEKERRRFKLLNILVIFCVVTTMAYLGIYIYLKASVAIVINSILILFYLFTIFWIGKRKLRIAVDWIFTSFILHIAALCIFIFTKETGYHFYLFCVPALITFLSAHERWPEKYIFTACSVLLFFIFELFNINIREVVLSPFTIRFLYVSSIFVVFFIGIQLVVVIFTKYINDNENAQEELIFKLKKSLSEVRTLQGFLPICSSCKRIRDDKGYWNQIESYIREHTDTEFSHSLCPECATEMYPDYDFSKPSRSDDEEQEDNPQAKLVLDDKKTGD
ncbi:MAG: hypothetical protein JEY99_20470 [Spirochaetales bacterium]|nr:hypothetical protein [Spirochaetales bacterium]